MRLRTGLTIVGALVALGIAGFGAWNSSWLKLRTVDVTGNHHTTTADVQAAAALTPGVRLTAVSGAAVAARVEALPWVASARVTHVLPSRIHIAVTERTPALLIQAGTHVYLADHGGAVLQEGGTGYPLVTGLPLSVSYPGARLTLPTLTAAIRVLDAIPADLRPRVASVAAPSEDLISVALSDHTTITYGTPDDLSVKNYDVTTLLAAGKAYASIDVRSSTHPAAVPR